MSSLSLAIRRLKCEPMSTLSLRSGDLLIEFASGPAIPHMSCRLARVVAVGRKVEAKPRAVAVESSVPFVRSKGKGKGKDKGENDGERRSVVAVTTPEGENVVVETSKDGKERVTLTGAHGGDLSEMRGVRQATQVHTADGEDLVTLKGLDGEVLTISGERRVP